VGHAETNTGAGLITEQAYEGITPRYVVSGSVKENRMLDKFEASNEVDGSGNPAGGQVRGVHLSIDWQNGPLGRDGNRVGPNGAFVETVIAAVLQRIEFYQTAGGGKLKCRENAIAITKLEEALLWLNKRTADREARQVEGTHVA
jgi:hypothetical protein